MKKNFTSVLYFVYYSFTDNKKYTEFCYIIKVLVNANETMSLLNVFFI